MAKDLVLVANPGSASRKYALFENDALVASLHFEYEKDDIIYTLSTPGKDDKSERVNLSHLAFATTLVVSILTSNGLLNEDDNIRCIGMRIVAPSTFFQTHRLLNKISLGHLKELEPNAILHISAILQETELLKVTLPNVPIWGISDSAFHSTKPLHSHSYAISQSYAHELDIWRFGYHGISVSSVVENLKCANKLPKRLIVCHLGGGASVTAVFDGKSLDSTMGYSPLEGLMMSTRSGSIDPTATEALRRGLNLDKEKLQILLNTTSGLLGVSNLSGDIRELLEFERSGKEEAKLALDMYVSRVQQAIGQMVAVSGGIDALVFTGTVGERSAVIRKRVVSNLQYLGLAIDAKQNHESISPKVICNISRVDHPVDIFIVPSDEEPRIAQHTRRLEDVRK